MYLAVGILVGPYVLGRLGISGAGFTSTTDVKQYDIFSEAALGFIAFDIGNEFRPSQLRKIGKQATVIAFTQALSATLMVVRQYKAKGPLTKILLPIVALDDAIGLIVFAISSGVARVLTSGGLDLISVVWEPPLEVVLSILLGALGGSKLMKCGGHICRYPGIMLFPRAGVALGMSMTVTETMEGGRIIRNITLFAVLAYELITPCS